MAPASSPNTMRGARNCHTTDDWVDASVECPSPRWLNASPRIRSVEIDVGPMTSPHTTATTKVTTVATVTTTTRRSLGGLVIGAAYFQTSGSASAFFTAAVIWFINSDRRGPQREATSSLRFTTWPLRTALTLANPCRFATLAGVILQQRVSARKINLGFALTMYSALSCGYPASALVALASAMLTTPSAFINEPTNVPEVSE